jgi:hypothetical protein
MFGTKLADLAPGESMMAISPYLPFDEDVPTLVRCYDDPMHEHYIGVAYRIFRVSVQWPDTEPWILRQDEIMGPNGYGVRGAPIAVRDQLPVSLRPKIAYIPREMINASADFQVINNTPGGLRLHLLVNGVEDEMSRRLGGLQYGEMIYRSEKSLLVTASSTQVTLEFILTDGGVPIKHLERTVSVPYTGVRADQFVISANDIR